MKQLPLTITALLLLAASVSVSANETYICLFGNNERTIRVTYANPDSKLPCEVVYEKETGSQVLWTAENEEGFCETQAADFVAKQQGWGWDCAKMEAAEDTPAAQPATESQSNTSS